MSAMSDREASGRGWSIAALVVGVGVAALVLAVVWRAPETASHEGDVGRIYRVPVDGAPSKGPDDALVTIVEFSDFQCPHCQAAAATVGRLVEEAGDVRLVFRHAPLVPAHPRAVDAAVASLAAHEQGRFWEYHDALFAGQAELGGRGDGYFDELARRLALDVASFQRARDRAALRRRVRDDRRLLVQLGQSAVPTFFVNGRALRGNLPADRFRAALDEARDRARRALAAGVARPDLYRALVADGHGPELPVPAPAPVGADATDGPICSPGDAASACE
jgi:protein-disulfide isomerase